MKYPFTLTEEIIDAYQAHVDYTSAGAAWLYKNDRDGQNEMVLIEEIQTAIMEAAEEHFGDDEDALDDFIDLFEVEDSRGCWYDVIAEQLETA